MVRGEDEERLLSTGQSHAHADEQRTQEGTRYFKVENKRQRLLGEHVRCMYYFERKMRFCGMQRKNGHLYCGLHLEEPQQQTDGGHDGSERVRCPYGNHTVLKKLLEKHMKMCPEYLLRKKLKSEPYYEQGVNRNTTRQPVMLPSITEFFRREKDTVANRRLAAIIRMGEDKFAMLVDKVESLWCRLGCQAVRQDVTVSLEMPVLSVEDKILESERHHIQQRSIFLHMDALEFFRDASSSSYIEFGSGKGYLTSMLVDLVRPKELQRVILLDRNAFKGKADTSMRRNNIHRIRCDIANFNPSKLEGMNGNSRWVGYGKHLCGAATDFSIRCMTNQLKRKETRPIGFAIASCCHHVTSWDQYVGSDILQKEGISPEEFEIICYMSGWSTCGSHHSGESRRSKGKSQQVDEEHESHVESNIWKPHKTISRSKRITIGTKCKDLIDKGRILYCLGLEGMKLAKNVLYVDPMVSIENRLLLGVFED